MYMIKMSKIRGVFEAGCLALLFAVCTVSLVAEEAAPEQAKTPVSPEEGAAPGAFDASSTGPAAAEAPQDAPPTSDRGLWTTGARLGDEVEEYYTDFMIPLSRGEHNVLFLNLRSSFLEDREQELNAGFVLRRHVSGKNLILGANVFYDSRWTENDNTFDQVGLGVEVLSSCVDFRANVYHPLTDEEWVSSSVQESVDTREEDGRRITTTTATRFDVYEEALEGFDVEVGVWLPFLDKTAPTAIYAGYYDFSADYGDDYAGIKARIESRVHPNVTLDAEWIEDKELNRTEYFAGVRIHLPINFWRGLRFDRAEGSRARPFAARMSEMVNRDFRIRTVLSETVLADVQNTITTRAINVPRFSAPEEADPVLVPVAPTPNCYLDANGDVVCQ
jgi:hypothetical protein